MQLMAYSCMHVVLINEIAVAERYTPGAGEVYAQAGPQGCAQDLSQRRPLPSQIRFYFGSKTLNLFL